MPLAYDDVPGSWGKQSEGWPAIHDPDQRARMLVIKEKLVPYGSYVTVGDMLRLERPEYVGKVRSAMTAPHPQGDASGPSRTAAIVQALDRAAAAVLPASMRPTPQVSGGGESVLRELAGIDPDWMERSCPPGMLRRLIAEARVALSTPQARPEGYDDGSGRIRDWRDRPPHAQLIPAWAERKASELARRQQPLGDDFAQATAAGLEDMLDGDPAPTADGGESVMSYIDRLGERIRRGMADVRRFGVNGSHALYMDRLADEAIEYAAALSTPRTDEPAPTVDGGAVHINAVDGDGTEQLLYTYSTRPLTRGETLHRHPAPAPDVAPDTFFVMAAPGWPGGIEVHPNTMGHALNFIRKHGNEHTMLATWRHQYQRRDYTPDEVRAMLTAAQPEGATNGQE